jgi:hypothetical protein
VAALDHHAYSRRILAERGMGMIVVVVRTDMATFIGTNWARCALRPSQGQNQEGTNGNTDSLSCQAWGIRP